jgi:methylated-DNA-[protein]-cysteine S-methyltransferase
MLYFETYESTLGTIYIVATDNAIVNVHIGETEWNSFEVVNKLNLTRQPTPLLKEAVKQFKEYLTGDRIMFELPLYQSGTDFQQRVWNVLIDIPYGQTWSYYDVASHIHSPKAVRAVGQANKANQLPIIVPCHRVIGKNKKLTGYAGNKVDLKEKLLRLEGALDTINHNI